MMTLLLVDRFIQFRWTHTHIFDNDFVKVLGGLLRVYCVLLLREFRCGRRTTVMMPIDLTQDNPRFNCLNIMAGVTYGSTCTLLSSILWIGKHIFNLHLQLLQWWHLLIWLLIIIDLICNIKHYVPLQCNNGSNYNNTCYVNFSLINITTFMTRQHDSQSSSKEQPHQLSHSKPVPPTQSLTNIMTRLCKSEPNVVGTSSPCSSTI